MVTQNQALEDEIRQATKQMNKAKEANPNQDLTQFQQSLDEKNTMLNKLRAVIVNQRNLLVKRGLVPKPALGNTSSNASTSSGNSNNGANNLDPQGAAGIAIRKMSTNGGQERSPAKVSGLSLDLLI